VSKWCIVGTSRWHTDSSLNRQLSADTLAALLEFKKEEEQRHEEFERLKNVAEERYEETKLSEVLEKKGMDLFQEDWQLSQFWVSIMFILPDFHK